MIVQCSAVLSGGTSIWSIGFDLRPAVGGGGAGGEGGTSWGSGGGCTSTCRSGLMPMSNNKLPTSSGQLP